MSKITLRDFVVVASEKYKCKIIIRGNEEFLSRKRKKIHLPQDKLDEVLADTTLISHCRVLEIPREDFDAPDIVLVEPKPAAIIQKKK